MPSIYIHDLEFLVQERLGDAKALLETGRYSGAVYICGYVVELGLKKKICQTLNWDEFPTDSQYKALKTHELEVLLHFSGVKKFVIANLRPEWSVVSTWDPEKRYSIGRVVEFDAKIMIESTETILRAL
ncbi:MAG: hypothetical protein NTX49_05020 [Chlamydiae bacterium]|nr:hypothetical protein [Chlamydiota bacterium]